MEDARSFLSSFSIFVISRSLLKRTSVLNDRQPRSSCRVWLAVDIGAFSACLASLRSTILNFLEKRFTSVICHNSVPYSATARVIHLTSVALCLILSLCL
jgi:hypothetical protein